MEKRDGEKKEEEDRIAAISCKIQHYQYNTLQLLKVGVG